MPKTKERKWKHWEHLRAGDILSSPVAAVRVDDPVRVAAETMAQRGISGLAVLDRGGKAVGVVSASDIVRYETTRRTIVLGERQYEKQVAEAGRRLSRGFHLEHIDDERVRSVMTPRIEIVKTDTPVTEVARVMACRKIHRVFVEERGRITGIVTAMDVVRCVGLPATPPRVSAPQMGRSR